MDINSQITKNIRKIRKGYPTEIPRDISNIPKYMQNLVDIVKDIIIEPDMQEFIWMYFGQCLGGNPKPNILILWGNGSNGKTLLVEIMEKTLTRANICRLTVDSLSNMDNTPTLKYMKNKMLVHYIETELGDILSVEKVKELLQSKAVHVLTTNNLPIVDLPDSDLMELFLVYNCKTKFVPNPEPNNGEKQRNAMLMDITNDINYKEAALNLLIEAKRKLMLEYNDNILDVPCPTIRGESLNYRAPYNEDDEIIYE